MYTETVKSKHYPHIRYLNQLHKMNAYTTNLCARTQD